MKEKENLNTYYEELKKFQTKIEFYANEIFKVYGNELLLRLEDYNLLSHKNNVIETSTAIGFIIEEFLVSKLETYSQTHILPNEYKILRHTTSTTNSSYDCFSNLNENIKALINVKVCKENSANNAVSAINELYEDYVATNPNEIKCFMVLKVHYNFNESTKDSQRKIFIKRVESFFLEEINFSNGHKQDHRNWSKDFNPASGRLQISNKFRKDNIVSEPEISYAKTSEFVKIMAGKQNITYTIEHK